MDGLLKMDDDWGYPYFRKPPFCTSQWSMRGLYGHFITRFFLTTTTATPPQQQYQYHYKPQSQNLTTASLDITIPFFQHLIRSTLPTQQQTLFLKSLQEQTTTTTIPLPQHMLPLWAAAATTVAAPPAWLEGNLPLLDRLWMTPSRFKTKNHQII